MGVGTARRGNAVGILASVGPGLAVAATGVGAGDLLAAMLAGARFGTALLWVILVGAVLKLTLNEGVARWQLATGTTLLEGWCRHLGRPFQVYFLLYLVVWSFIVAAGLMSACGVAAHALLPVLGIRWWAVLHSLAALGLVMAGRYGFFEGVMKLMVGLMVVTLLVSVILVAPDLLGILRGLTPTMPATSAPAVLSLMGGVGGSVTLLSYGYWIREKGWSGDAALRPMRLDLGVGYVLTAAFAVMMLLLAAVVLGGAGMPPGSAGLVACGNAIAAATGARLGTWAGAATRAVFLVGVWGAVFSSTLGVWQGVPYLFADYVGNLGRRGGAVVDSRGWAYRSYLLYLALPPMILLTLDRPIWVIQVYTVTGALFMPLLAASLLWLNSRPTLVGARRNRSLATPLLVGALLLFVLIALREVVDLWLR